MNRDMCGFGIYDLLLIDLTKISYTYVVYIKLKASSWNNIRDFPHLAICNPN